MSLRLEYRTLHYYSLSTLWDVSHPITWSGISANCQQIIPPLTFEPRHHQSLVLLLLLPFRQREPHLSGIVDQMSMPASRTYGPGSLRALDFFQSWVGLHISERQFMARPVMIVSEFAVRVIRDTHTISE
jgi:hypothetical protein